jgi:hypothetical protein
LGHEGFGQKGGVRKRTSLKWKVSIKVSFGRNYPPKEYYEVREVSDSNRAENS